MDVSGIETDWGKGNIPGLEIPDDFGTVIYRDNHLKEKGYSRDKIIGMINLDLGP